jgi:hypothetical protein
MVFSRVYNHPSRSNINAFYSLLLFYYVINIFYFTTKIAIKELTPLVTNANMALSLYTYLTNGPNQGIDNLGIIKEVENTHVNSHFHWRDRSS